MALDSFEKQPYEQFWISASFANNLGDSESIVQASSAVTATDSAGDDATGAVVVAGTATVSGDTLRCQITGGAEALSPYKITFRIVTDASPINKWEKDVRMKVKEL